MTEDRKFSDNIQIKEEPITDHFTEADSSSVQQHRNMNSNQSSHIAQNAQSFQVAGHAGSGASGQSGSNSQQDGTRQNSLQRIQQRKQKVYKLPKNQKMAKLSMYSACQYPQCRCIGWKTPEESRHNEVENNYCPKFSEECRNQDCKHALGTINEFSFVFEILIS